MSNHNKIRKHIEWLVLLIGVVFVLLGCIIKTGLWNIFFISLGAACVSTSIYNLIFKVLISKYGRALPEYENNKTTTHVLYDANDYTEFVNIGKFNDVIKNDFKFKSLIEQKEYIGQTVLIFGTDFQTLQERDVGSSLKDALQNKVNFNIVLTDPDSMCLLNKDRRPIDKTIDVIKEIIEEISEDLNDSQKYEGGSIELRLCPFVDRLHSFSLFEKTDSRIATLDFSFGEGKRFSQMFFDKNNIKNEMMNHLIEYYRQMFDNSIPYIRFPIHQQEIKVYLKKDENIIVLNGNVPSVNYSDATFSKKYNKEKRTINQLILQTLFQVEDTGNEDTGNEDTGNEDTGNDNNTFQLLQAFGKDCIAGRIINKNVKLKDGYEYSSKWEKLEIYDSLRTFLRTIY